MAKLTPTQTSLLRALAAHRKEADRRYPERNATAIGGLTALEKWRYEAVRTSALWYRVGRHGMSRAYPVTSYQALSAAGLVECREGWWRITDRGLAEADLP